MFEYAKTLVYAKLFKQEPEEVFFSDFPICDLQWERLTCLKLMYASPGYFHEYPPPPPMNFYLRLFLSSLVVGFVCLLAYMFFEMYEEQIMKAIELTKGAIVSTRSVLFTTTANHSFQKYCKGIRESFASKQCKAESQTESALLDVNPASRAYFNPAGVSQWRDQADLAFPFASPNSIGSVSSYNDETDDISNFFSDALDMFTSPSSIEDPAEPLYKEIAQLKEERVNLTVGLVVLAQERSELQSQLRLEEQLTAEMQASVEELSANHSRISERQIGRITTLLDSIAERAEEATELRSTEAILRDQIVLLSAQVSDLSSKITSLSSQVDALSTQHQQDLITIADFKHASSAQEQAAANAKANSEKQRDRIALLSAQCEQNEVLIANLQHAGSAQEQAAAVAKASSDNQQDRIAQLSAQCEQNEVLIANLNAAAAENVASSAEQKAAQDQQITQLQAQKATQDQAIAQLQVQLAQVKGDALTARNAHQSEAKKEAQKLAAAQKEAATEKRTKERCIKLASVAHKVFASVSFFA